VLRPLSRRISRGDRLSIVSDATGLAESIRLGELSPREAAEEAIRRIERLNPELNAVVNTRFEQALSEIDRGLPNGPFTGVPFLVKDLGVEVAGLPATRGSRLFADAIAKQDSPLITRFREAGLVVLGTTNTPEFGTNASTEPLLHGPTRNPWRTTHSPGGSSGGSAAAVASGMVPIAHGNDAGGSIRIPSSMCGLFGFKPSRGRVRGALIGDEFASPLSVQHVLTTSVRDSAAMLDAVCAALPGEPYAAPTSGSSYAAAVAVAPRALRIAVCTSTSSGHATANACVAAAEAAAKLCESLGHHVTNDAPVYDFSAASMASAAAMSATSVATIRRRLAELGRELADDDVEPFTRFLYDRSSSMTAEQLVEALRTIELTGRAIAPFFEKYDILITPTLAATVPPLGLLDTSRPQSMFEHAGTYASYTSPFNITGQPAMSMPLASDETGLPVGVQFVAATGREGLLFQLAGQLEQAAPWQRTV
jgi:amidase